MNGSHCIWYEISHSFYSNRRCLQATNLSQPASIHSPLFFHHFCLVKYFLNDFYQNNSHLDFKFNTFFFWLNIYKTWKFSYFSYKTENMNINWKFDRMFFFLVPFKIHHVMLNMHIFILKFVWVNEHVQRTTWI